MSDLTGIERRKLERLFSMSSGYVLNFSDRTFSDFFDEYNININTEPYLAGGTSKANRMRMFWKLNDNITVGRITKDLIDYAQEQDCLGDKNPTFLNECRRIPTRLLSKTGVSEAESLRATTNDRDFEVVAEHIRQAIEKQQPEGALDRLHTFTIKFIRNICITYEIDTNRDKPLHSLFGEYIKALRGAGLIESDMTERILKSSISVLDAFNDVRNNKSLAHDNPILNYEESLLIFNHVAASIRFIREIEEKNRRKRYPDS